MNKKTSFIISLCCVLPIIWASRFVARCHGVLALRAALVGSLLASGYPLHHLRAHGFAIRASVVPLLCASRKAEPFLSQKTYFYVAFKTVCMYI
jgi:hypothetical protein